MTTTNDDNDDVIIDGLALIRQGIVDGDWHSVCAGYNSISGEDLQPPDAKPKQSKLDRIRAGLNKSSEKKTTKKIKDKEIVIATDILSDDETPKINWSSLNVTTLKDVLRKRFGVKNKELSNKSKAALIKLGKSLEKTIANVSVVTKEREDGMQIISTEFDEREAQANQAAAATKVKIPVAKRDTRVKDTSDTDSDYRYHDNPDFKPPWR